LSKDIIEMNHIKIWLELLKEHWSKDRTINNQEDLEIHDFDHQPYIDCYLSE